MVVAGLPRRIRATGGATGTRSLLYRPDEGIPCPRIPVVEGSPAIPVVLLNLFRTTLSYAGRSLRGDEPRTSQTAKPLKLWPGRGRRLNHVHGSPVERKLDARVSGCAAGVLLHQRKHLYQVAKTCWPPRSMAEASGRSPLDAGGGWQASRCRRARRATKCGATDT